MIDERQAIGKGKLGAGAVRSSSATSRVDTPRVYEVRVQGWVSSRWEDWLDGMTCTREEGDDALAVTVLSGRLADQSALLGLLQSLHNLGFPILAVRAV